VEGLDEGAGDRVDEGHPGAEVSGKCLHGPQVLPEFLPGVEDPELPPVVGLLDGDLHGLVVLLVVHEAEPGAPLARHVPVERGHLEEVHLVVQSPEKSHVGLRVLLAVPVRLLPAVVPQEGDGGEVAPEGPGHPVRHLPADGGHDPIVSLRIHWGSP